MPHCSVVNCKSSSSKGFRLFRLPSAARNAERRQLWCTLIARPTLYDDARICECHFSNDQFENGRMDGKKMLRPNAFPDLLQVDDTDRIQIEEKILPGCSDFTNTENTILEDPINDCENSVRKAESSDDEQLVLPNDSLENSIHVIENLKKNLKSALRKCRNYEKMLQKRNPNNVEKIFNEDQLEYLQTDKRRGTMWSEDTITKALKLYMACGTEGYNEIRNQNLPYPSIRTLQHRLKNMKFNTGIFEDENGKLEVGRKARNTNISGDISTPPT